MFVPWRTVLYVLVALQAAQFVSVISCLKRSLEFKSLQSQSLYM
jgi:hypothetical protein